MFVRLVSLVLSGALFAACGPLPSCEEVQLEDLEVEVAEEAPVFSWQGDAASLSVESAGQKVEMQWSLRCNCLAEQEHPDQNKGCKETEEEFAFRHCLQGPIPYGESPPIDTLVQPGDFDGGPENGAAKELVSGESYDVRVEAYCAGEEANLIEVLASFIAR